jgi:hypothetical protein
MSVNYRAIADAVLPEEDYQTAFARMSAETVTETVEGEVWVTELSIMSRLGVVLADTILTKIEAAVPARVQRMIQSDKGINLNDPQTLALVNGLVAATILTQDEADALLAPLSTTKPKWPGLAPGHVQNAMQWRAGGII